MKCLNCGTEYEYGNFCPVCGYDNSLSESKIDSSDYDKKNEEQIYGGLDQMPTSIQQNINGNSNNMFPANGQNYPIGNLYGQTKKNKKPVNKKTIIIISAIVMATVIAVVIILALSNRPKTVKLNAYIKIETLDGYDGYGKVVFTIDRESFKRDYSEIEFTDEYIDELRKEYGDYTDTYLKRYPAIEQLTDCLSGEFDKKNRLSNGDTVHFIWKLDKSELEKKFNIKLRYSNVDYSIEGLAKAETFDPFENIEVCFTGVDPNAVAEYEIKNKDRYNSDLKYQFDKDSGLKNGDYIKLSVLGNKSEDELFEYCINTFGMIPELYEKSYVVTADKYLDSGEIISQDIIDKMTGLTRDHIEAHSSEYFSSTEKFIDLTYIGYYFLKAKFEEKIDNSLYLLFRVRASNEAIYDDFFEYYFYINYDNLRVNTDGKIEYDESEYSFPVAKYDSFWGTYEGTIFKVDDYWYAGYARLDDFVNDKIVANKELYTFEENISDLDPNALIENCTYVSSLVGKEMAFNGHRYMVVEKKLMWNEAETRCESDGGHLVTITSEDEQKFVERILGRKSAWIGAYKDGDAWKWVTDEKMDYVKWSDKDGKYATMESDHYWSNERYSKYYYICEWDN